MEINKSRKTPPRSFYYFLLGVVVFIWGLDPTVYSNLYKYYSAVAMAAVSALFSAIFLFAISIKKIKSLNMRYVKAAVYISIFNTLAGILQKVGLQYTTPACYSFLEHLSCITVPLITLVVLKKRPSVMQWSAATICLVGCMVLTGFGTEQITFGVGEILCAVAGLMYGAGFCAMGQCPKDLDIKLVIMLHMIFYTIVSTILAFTLDAIYIGGVPMEELTFSFDPVLLVPCVLYGMISVGVSWLLMTEATRHTNPAAVSVITPFGAVIASIISIIVGTDTLKPSLVIASFMILCASIISGLSPDEVSKLKKSKRN